MNKKRASKKAGRAGVDADGARGDAGGRTTRGKKKGAVRPRTGGRRGAASNPEAEGTRAGADERAYTDPDLRERIKDRVMREDKGGMAGQWSARKAQLVAREYEEAGGGYRGKRTAAQKHLSQWTNEEWTTRDGEPARRERTSGGGEEMARYLPRAAWARLSADERAATDAKKRRGSRRGEQFVSNTPAAKTARKRATNRTGSGTRPKRGRR